MAGDSSDEPSDAEARTVSRWAPAVGWVHVNVAFPTLVGDAMPMPPARTPSTRNSMRVTVRPGMTARAVMAAGIPDASEAPLAGAVITAPATAATTVTLAGFETVVAPW